MRQGSIRTSVAEPEPASFYFPVDPEFKGTPARAPPKKVKTIKYCKPSESYKNYQTLWLVLKRLKFEKIVMSKISKII